MLTKAQEYLAQCKDTEVERSYNTFKLKANVPTRGGLARYLNVGRNTLYEWAQVHPDFQDIMEAIGAEQEERLINNGLTGDYNPTIAKVLLAKHGYREAVDTDVTSGGEKLSVNLISYDAQRHDPPQLPEAN